MNMRYRIRLMARKKYQLHSLSPFCFLIASIYASKHPVKYLAGAFPSSPVEGSFINLSVLTLFMVLSSYCIVDNVKSKRWVSTCMSILLTVIADWCCKADAVPYHVLNIRIAFGIE